MDATEIENRLSGWLTNRVDEFKCPVCNSKKWRSGEIVCSFPYEGGLAASKATPLVQIVCSHCGYVLRFTGAVIGIRQ